jgi:hypothetical protein
LLETFRSQLAFEFKRNSGCAFKISKQSPLSVPVPGGSKLEWKKITGKSHPAQAGGHCRGRVADGFEKEVGKTKRERRSGKMPEPMLVALAAPVYPTKGKGGIRLLL